MTLLLKNKFISLLPLEKEQEEKLLFKVTNRTARTKTHHHLWTVNIIYCLGRNANQGLFGYFSSIEYCLLFCVKGYFFKGEKRLYLRKELPATVSLYRFYWVFSKSWNKWFVSSIYFFLFLIELCNTFWMDSNWGDFSDELDTLFDYSLLIWSWLFARRSLLNAFAYNKSKLQYLVCLLLAFVLIFSEEKVCSCKL